MSSYVVTLAVAGAAANQNLLSLENPTGSPVVLIVEKALVRVSVNVVDSTLFNYQFARTTVLPTGGTVQTAAQTTSTAAAPNAIARTGPTATLAANLLSRWPNPAAPTLVGSILPAEIAFHPNDVSPLLVQPGEAVLIFAGANLTTITHIPYFAWRES